MKNKIRIPYTVQKCYDNSKGVSEKAILDLRLLETLLNELTETASKHTHYDRLDEWSEPIFELLNKMLMKYGFINGGGSEQPIDATFWWNIYDIVSSCIYSSNLESLTAAHHSSAFERNESLKKDFIQLQNLLNN